MSTAPKSLLEQIHEMLAEAMLAKLQDTENPAEAKDWAVIVKFLKDNNIDALPAANEGAESALERLMAKAQESIGRHQ